MSTFRLPDTAHIGYVHVRVRDLERSLAFYLDVLGLRLASGGMHTATLSATGRGPGLLVLTEKKDATARPSRASGLYHMAFRVPSRRALAMAIQHLRDSKWPLDGFADHDVSEAVYLSDPEGNGIEVYSDRPRATWPLRGGQVEMVTVPLDLDALMRELADWPGIWEGIDTGTDVGHIHLRVSDLERTEAFYSGLLGFDVTQRSLPGALFMSAGGYHHHVGANVWHSEGGVRPPADAIGLISYSIIVPGADALHALDVRLRDASVPVRTGDDGSLRAGDPDGNFVELVAE
jgi:catechol 2,3-dioxygenase